MSYVGGDPTAFDDKLQESFPSPQAVYIPVITQFGVSFEQRIRLGTTDSHFAFQEVVVLGGLDQSLLLPTVAFMIGFRSHTGLEFGMGPSIGFTGASSSRVPLGISVVYALGWTFTFSDVYIPVDLAINRTPRDGLSRFTLMTGFNF